MSKSCRPGFHHGPTPCGPCIDDRGQQWHDYCACGCDAYYDTCPEFREVKEPPVGLSRGGHHLYWGSGSGWLLNWPMGIKRPVMSVWNFIACLLLGHDHLIQEEMDGPVECVSCMRAVGDPGPEAPVIREWKWVEEVRAGYGAGVEERWISWESNPREVE